MPPPPDFGSMLGTMPSMPAFQAPADLQQQAAMLANARIQPEVTALTGEGTRLAQAFADLSKRTGDIYQQLGPMVGAVGAGVQGIYSNAAKAQADLAKGFSSAMTAGQAASTGADAAFLQGQGAPGEQIANVKAAGSGGGDVLYGTGGFIPASTLNAQGAALGGYAATMPAVAARAGQESIQDINNQAARAQQVLSQQLQNVYAQLPSLQADAASELWNQAMELYRLQSQQVDAERQWRLQQAGMGLDVWKAQQGAAMDMASLSERAWEQQQQSAYQQAGLGLDAWKAQQGMGLDIANALANVAGQSYQGAMNTYAAQLLALQSGGRPKVNSAVSNALGYIADDYGNPIGGQTTPTYGAAYDAAKLAADEEAARLKALKDAAAARKKAVAGASAYKNTLGQRIDPAYLALQPKPFTTAAPPVTIKKPGVGAVGTIPNPAYNIWLQNKLASQKKPTYQAAFQSIYGTLKREYGTTGVRGWRYGVRDTWVRKSIRDYLLAAKGLTAGPSYAPRRP